MSTAVSHLPFSQANATEADIKRIFERQRETALRWRTSTVDERKGRIKRLKAAIIANTPALYEAAWKDFSRPQAEVDFTELLPVMTEISDALRHLKGWMKPKGVWPTRSMIGTKAWVQHEPKGRALIISPWNYPENLTFGPLVSALAAGCTAFLKPSEMTPHTSAWMVKVVREVFPEDEVAIVEGDASTATALLNLPFDHIFFTGSPAIGKVVMAAAAKNLTSVTLELGGKSPTIIDQTADIKLAAENIMWGKFTNCGQTCIAPDYVYVHESVKDEFVKHSLEALKKSYGATPQEQMKSPSLAHIVNERHTQRVGGMLADAKQKGARPLCGDFVSVKDHFVAPTLLENCPPDSRVMTEEIFGPLLPILTFKDLDQVLAHVNAEPKPLALYIWSRNEAVIEKVLKNTSAGGTCINHSIVHFGHGNLPFGGVNNSGIGNSHGLYGFKAFSHERAVLRSRIMLAKMFFPPYTPFVQTQIKNMVKMFQWW